MRREIKTLDTLAEQHSCDHSSHKIKREVAFYAVFFDYYTSGEVDVEQSLIIPACGSEHLIELVNQQYNKLVQLPKTKRPCYTIPDLVVDRRGRIQFKLTEKVISPLYNDDKDFMSTYFKVKMYNNDQNISQVWKRIREKLEL